MTVVSAQLEGRSNQEVLCNVLLHCFLSAITAVRLPSNQMGRRKENKRSGSVLPKAIQNMLHVACNSDVFIILMLPGTHRVHHIRVIKWVCYNPYIPTQTLEEY